VRCHPHQGQRVRLGIRSPWVADVPQSGSYLPISISGLETNVAMDGTIKGLIKSPRESPPNSEPFRCGDTLQVFAVMTGVNREVPSIVEQYQWTVEYPLRLVKPIFLEAICIDDTFNIEWTVSVSNSLRRFF
jgi:hypothetical protein